MNKIAPDHLAREAVVYIRQSTPDQLRHNHESRRRQYGLADRARGLGWDEPVIIDEDLGRSGGRDVTAGLRSAAGGDLRRACRHRAVAGGFQACSKRP